VPLRVLIVDDNRDAADSLGLIFEINGADVRVAYDGADALRQAVEFRPHVGLFDVDMPGMSGLDLARTMRERQGDGPLLLIAVTGVDTDDARGRTTLAGFDGHITKPADPTDLDRVAWDFFRAHFPGEG
jgi:DNA-binding response OmpR family regulator